MDTHHTFRHCTMFLTGVVVCACGIAFISRAGLGTSPISSIPFILSLVAPPVLTTGLLPLVLPHEFHLQCIKKIAQRTAFLLP